MTKFKEGDRVEILSDGLECEGVPEGTHGTVQEDDTVPFVLWDVGNGDRIWATDEDELKLVERNMENLQAGDILVNDESRHNLTVQGQVGAVFFTISTDDQTADLWCVDTLKRHGWKLKDSDPEIIELTLAEVAERLNIPKLRIKE